MTERQVVVVGGGPVGLSAAVLLGRLGVDVLLVERRATPSTHPKATIINTRTMELLRHWGVEDDVRDRGLPLEHSGMVTWMTSIAGFEIGHLDLIEDGGRLDEMLDQSPTLSAVCPQDVLEPILADAARRHPTVEVRFGTEAVAVDQGRDGVEVVLRPPDGTRTRVRADYVIAADGPQSSVRARLGVAETGAGALGELVNVYFRADLGELTARCPSVLYWIIHPSVRAVVHALDGSERWLLNVFRALDGGNGWTTDRCLALVRAAVGVDDLDVEIRSIKPWTMNALVADRFSSGRIFLAGDSAHQLPPTGGFGMNTGIQDVHNLCWKLAAVLDGWAAPSLLDTYETERRPVAEANLDQCVLNARKIMQMLFEPGADPRALAEDGQQARALRDRVAAAIPGQRDHFDFQGEALGAIYRSPAITPDGSEPPLVANPIADYLPSAHPGARAPHAWLTRASEEVSTLDLFGDRFVVLAGPDAAGWCDAAAIELGVPVDLHCVDAGNVDGFLALYGLERDGAVLVRPDGHVAWRAASAAPDALRAALGVAVGRRAAQLEQEVAT